MSGVPYLMHAAVVHGPAAVGVGRVLRRATEAGWLDGVDPATRSAVTAIFQAAQAALRIGNAEVGTSATTAPAVRAPSPHEVLSVNEIMGVFGVRERQARNIAATLGYKSAGRWVVDASAAAAEVERRGAA